MSKTLRRAALLVLMTMLVCAVAWASGDIDWDTPAAGQNLSGNAAMAKAGSGDVLAGVIVGILAQQCEPYTSACLGVFLHGLAGDMARDKKGAYSVLASDLVAEISSVLKNI